MGYASAAMATENDNVEYARNLLQAIWFSFSQQNFVAAGFVQRVDAEDGVKGWQT